MFSTSSRRTEPKQNNEPLPPRENPRRYFYTKNQKGWAHMSNLFYSGSGRHTSGAFTVTMKDGAKLAKQIAKLENGGKAAIQRTVSDFNSRAPAWVSKGIRQHYGVDTAAIKSAGPQKKRGATHINVAGVSVDGATLEYKGRTLTPTHFKMSPKSRPTKRRRTPILIPGQMLNSSPEVGTVRPPAPYQITAQIIKGQRARLPDNTFMGAGKVPTIPFQRTGSGRGPLEAVHTLSVPQMIDGRAKETIETMISEGLEKRFAHHVQQAMK